MRGPRWPCLRWIRKLSPWSWGIGQVHGELGFLRLAFADLMVMIVMDGSFMFRIHGPLAAMQRSLILTLVSVGHCGCVGVSQFILVLYLKRRYISAPTQKLKHQCLILFKFKLGDSKTQLSRIIVGICWSDQRPLEFMSLR